MITEGPLVYKLDGPRMPTFTLLQGGRETIVERTGYRDNTPSAIIPRIPHYGRMEEDLIYAKDSNPAAPESGVARPEAWRLLAGLPPSPLHFACTD